MKVPDGSMAMCPLVGEDEFIDRYAPKHGGVRRPCGSCRRPVWVSPQTQDLEGVTALCGGCAFRRAEELGRVAVVLTPGAAAEAKQIRRAKDAYDHQN